MNDDRDALIWVGYAHHGMCVARLGYLFGLSDRRVRAILTKKQHDDEISRSHLQAMMANGEMLKRLTECEHK